MLLARGDIHFAECLDEIKMAKNLLTGIRDVWATFDHARKNVGDEKNNDDMAGDVRI